MAVTRSKAHRLARLISHLAIHALHAHRLPRNARHSGALQSDHYQGPHRFGLIYLDIPFPVEVPGKTKHATIVSEILEIGS